VVLETLGHEDEALVEYEAARAGRPALAQPRTRLAAIWWRRGERERALRLLDEAAALEVDAADAQAIEILRGSILDDSR
jgi:hypothetical protein